MIPIFIFGIYYLNLSIVFNGSAACQSSNNTRISWVSYHCKSMTVAVIGIFGILGLNRNVFHLKNLRIIYPYILCNSLCPKYFSSIIINMLYRIA